MIRYFISGILLFVSLFVSSQKKWDLDDCIQQAIKENLQLKQTVIDNNIGKEDLRQSHLGLLPNLNGSLNTENNYGRSIDPSNNEIVSTQLFQASASVGTSLVLFQGFENLNRVQYCRFNVLKGTITEETLRNDIAFKVMNAYFDLCFTKGQLQIAKEQLSLSKMNLNKIKVMVDAGIKAATDIADMEARLALDDFKLTQAQNNVYKAKLALQQLLNNSNDHSFEIQDETLDGLIEPIGIPDPDSAYILATQHLPQFREMAVDARLSGLNLAIAKGDRFPVFRAQAGYGTGYYDSYRDSYGNLIGFRSQINTNGYQYVGLSMSIPLFNGGQVNKSIHTARWNVEKTNTTNEIKKREFFTEIQNACLALKSSVDEYHSALTQEKATALNLKLAEKKWEQGTGNLLELTDARNRQSSAQAEMLRTRLQYQLKMKTLQIFTGKLKFN